MRSDSWGHEFCPLFGGRRCLFVGGWECMECMLLSAGGMVFVHWWEVVCSSECPLSEVPLYNYITTLSVKSLLYVPYVLASYVYAEAQLIIRLDCM